LKDAGYPKTCGKAGRPKKNGLVPILPTPDGTGIVLKILVFLRRNASSELKKD
jgi:hypothetical protein